MRRTIELLIGVALLGASVGLSTAVQAQAFDGSWTGRDGCPTYGNQQAWSEVRIATIVQNHFRFERNSSTLYELTEGTVQPDGTITATGQGQRRDRAVTWTAQFSGKASAAAMRLTGTRSRGRSCSIELTNTRPAPYSFAGQEIARQQQLAEAEAGKRAEAERQPNADAARQAAAGKAQREKSAKEKVAEIQLQQLRSDAEAAKQKVAEFDKQLGALQAAQQTQQQATDKQAGQQKATEAQLQQLRGEADAAKRRAENAEKELAALRAAQEQDRTVNQKTQQIADDASVLLKEMILPPDEQPDDWIQILWKATVPIQQQQFCRIINRFYPDLASIEHVKNEIRRNMLYRDRQKDFETLLPSGRFENWVLRVKEVKQADDGNASILLQAPCRVRFGSDTCKKQKSNIRATIKKESTMFRELTKVSQDDFVVASGTIILLSHENQRQELPQYAVYKPGEYCAVDTENGKEEEVFVSDMNYLVQLR